MAMRAMLSEIRATRDDGGQEILVSRHKDMPQE
jgi:hypothetical protein